MRVNVHRNLNWRDGKGFSILDTSQRLLRKRMYVVLKDCLFVIQPSGRKRCIEQGQRNVHAFVRGELVGDSNGHLSAEKMIEYGYEEISYNPFDEDKGFFRVSDQSSIYRADDVQLIDGKAWVPA